MKTNKLVTLLLASFLVGAVGLTACTAADAIRRSMDGPAQTIPPYEPPTPPEPGKNISSIDILHLPSDGEIYMGGFDSYGISYQIRYDDGSKDDEVPLTYDSLPDPIKEVLGKEGEHTISIQIRGVKTSFTITVVDTHIRYTVNFLNYDGTVLDTQQVKPYNRVSYEGATPRKEPERIYKYRFIGWDHDLEETFITEDTDITTVYSRLLANNDYVGSTEAPILVDTYTQTGPYSSTEKYACFYAGRMTNIPIVREHGASSVRHTEGNEEIISYYISGEDDSPMEYDSTDYDDRHPLLTNTLDAALKSVYTYNDGDVDPSILPAARSTINLIDKDFHNFNIGTMNVTDVRGRSYTTSANTLEDYMEANFGEDSYYIDDVTIPSDLESGDYRATVYLDVDVYLYVFVLDTQVGLQFSNILAMASPYNIYVDVGEDAKLPSRETSTDDIDLMNINVGYMYQTAMNLE